MDCAFEGRGPDSQGLVFWDAGFAHEGGQGTRVELATFGEVRVAADFAQEVVFGFAVLVKCGLGRME